MKKISYYVIFIVVLGSIFVSFWVYQRYFKGDGLEFLSFTVERGSIQDVVRVRGEVVLQKEFDLSFPFSGIIDKVFVQEGQSVNQGNPLIKLETIDFVLEINKLSATLIQNQSSLDKLIFGATEEDIQILETKATNAQKSVDDAKIDLQNTQDKANNDLASVYGDVLDILNDAYAKADDALHKQVDQLFSNDDTDSPQLTFALTSGQVEIDAEAKRVLAGDALQDFEAELNILSSSDFSALDSALTNDRDRLGIIRDFFNKLNDAVNNSAGLSATTISTYKTNINTARDNINTAISNINNQEQDIASQKITNKDNIDSAQASLNDAESALDLARRNLDFKKAGARTEDIEIASAKIQEIESQIAITREKIRKSTLYAPGAAKVIEILLEKGELFSAGNIAISLSTSGHKIQADVSELEIGKIREVNGNDVSIQLDAFPGQEFSGKVLSIDSQEIDKDGDKYYRVNVYLDSSSGQTIRSGMSADLIIKSFFKDNVLKIPEFVVYRKENKRFVKVLEDGEQTEIEVEIGISDGESVEIKSGLKEGQIVAVSMD